MEFIKVDILKYLNFCFIFLVFFICDIGLLDRKGMYIKFIINFFFWYVIS